MSRLLELQTSFQKAVDDEREQFHSAIVETSTFSKSERLAIYADGYVLRLIESLETDYPKLKTLMGERRFSALAESYIKTHPSLVRSLRWYGTDFADWLLNHSHVKNTAFIAEMARFESALIDSFDAEDQLPMTMDYVSSLPSEAWPTLYLQAVDSVKLISLQYNTVEVWMNIRQKKRPKPIKKLSEPVTWQIGRMQNETQFRSLSPYAAWATRLVLQGINFADLCSGLCDFIPEESAALEAATLLKTWLQEEALLAC